MTDDELGIAWWNSLTERERARWSEKAGNTGRAKDAWEAFKASPPPYPFCRTPDKCRGKGYCPAEYACND